jgi:hypothetical protein
MPADGMPWAKFTKSHEGKKSPLEKSCTAKCTCAAALGGCAKILSRLGQLLVLFSQAVDLRARQHALHKCSRVMGAIPPMCERISY